MLVHLVCFKYKSETDQAARDDHRTRVAALSSLAGIVELKSGPDVVRSARSFDTGLLVVFRDRAALDAYQKDAQHVPVAQFGASICEQVVTVDFDA